MAVIVPGERKEDHKPYNLRFVILGVTLTSNKHSHHHICRMLQGGFLLLVTGLSMGLVVFVVELLGQQCIGKSK